MMEQRGQINRYTPYKWEGQGMYSINLADGVTPFMLMWNGKEYSSECYRLNHPLPGPIRTNVAVCWYRPTKDEFMDLHPSVKAHVLNGGLLHAPMNEAFKQLPNDPVETKWDYEEFQAWALEYYGSRLPPMEKA